MYTHLCMYIIIQKDIYVCMYGYMVEGRRNPDLLSECSPSEWGSTLQHAHYEGSCNEKGFLGIWGLLNISLIK